MSIKSFSKIPPPPPHPLLSAWVCQSCGWLGQVGPYNNPYDKQQAAGVTVAAVGGAGVATGGGGMALGLILVGIGVVIALIGVPLLPLFGIGIFFIIIGVIIAVLGIGVLILGGGIAATSATVATAGVATGVSAHQAGTAHSAAPNACPVCKQAIIPCSSPMGQKLLESNKELLKPIQSEIDRWAHATQEYNVKYKNQLSGHKFEAHKEVVEESSPKFRNREGYERWRAEKIKTNKKGGRNFL